MTRVFLMLGSPVGQVRSPALFNAAFARTGHDATMVALDVPAPALPAAFDLMRRSPSVGGAIVTLPHKRVAFDLVDGWEAVATELEAVNVVRVEDGVLIGTMTDGEGLLGAMATHGVSPRGRRARIVGAGGAGRAFALSLCRGGIDALEIVDPDAHAAARLRDLAARTGVPTRIVPAGAPAGDLDLLVNATPLGMAAGDAFPVALDDVHPGTVLVDAVTRPSPTVWLEAGARRGLVAVEGPEIARGQASVIATFLGMPEAVIAALSPDEFARQDPRA